MQCCTRARACSNNHYLLVAVASTHVPHAACFLPPAKGMAAKLPEATHEAHVSQDEGCKETFHSLLDSRHDD
jgi:hypothetical protein